MVHIEALTATSKGPELAISDSVEAGRSLSRPRVSSLWLWLKGGYSHLLVRLRAVHGLLPICCLTGAYCHRP